MRKSQKPKKVPSKELLYLGERLAAARTASGLKQQKHEIFSAAANAAALFCRNSSEILSESCM